MTSSCVGGAPRADNIAARAPLLGSRHEARKKPFVTKRNVFLGGLCVLAREKCFIERQGMYFAIVEWCRSNKLSLQGRTSGRGNLVS